MSNFRPRMIALPPRPKNLVRSPVNTEAKGRTWYRFKNAAQANETDLYLFDEIGGWGIWADEFAAELADITSSQINLHINSPGGDVFDGLAIMNLLIQHEANVTVYVDGMAASIASVIAMSGNDIVMAAHSMMMIHDAMGMTIGNAADHKEMMDLLDLISGDIAALYSERAGGTADQWRTAMLATTWYKAEDAVDSGLANRVDTVVGDDSNEQKAAAKYAGMGWWATLVPPKNDKRWVSSANSCETCQANADQGEIPDDEFFDSGDSEPPAHPNCDCDKEDVAGEDPLIPDAGDGQEFAASAEEFKWDADLFRSAIMEGVR